MRWGIEACYRKNNVFFFTGKKFFGSNRRVKNEPFGPRKGSFNYIAGELGVVDQFVNEKEL